MPTKDASTRTERLMIRVSPEKLETWRRAAEVARQADPELDFSAWVRRALDAAAKREGK